MKMKTVPELRFPGFEGAWCCNATTGSLCELIVDCVNKTAPIVEETTPFKMLRTTNIRNGIIDSFNCRRVTQETYETWTRRAKVERGDVILTREAPIGEVGYVDFDDTVFLGQRLMQYRVNPARLDARYLLYSFLSPGLRDQFAAHDGTGSTVSHIRVGDCSRFTVTHPTLPEQRKIAEFLTAVDGRIGQLSQKKALLEDYKKGVMQQLFTQALRFKDDHGNDFSEWEEMRLGELCATFKSGKGITSEEIEEDGEYPVYGGNGRRGYANTFTHEGEFLLIGRQGALCGNINRVSGKSYISEHAIAVAGNELANTEWLAQRLHHLNLNRLSESSAQPGLAVNKLERLKLLTPSVPEQTKIANFLTALDRKIESVAQQIRHTQAFKKGLLQQMFV